MASGYKIGCEACMKKGPSHSGTHDMRGHDWHDTVGGYGSYGNLAPTPAGGMPRTIEEMLASGRLSQAQIQAASMPNVMSLFDAPAAHKAEMAHFLQRFILDGYMRGVDVVAKIRAKPSFYLGVTNIQGAGVGRPSSAVATATSARALFDDSYWRPDSSYGSKLQTFYHEMGHAILNQRHTEKDSGSWIMSSNGPGGGWMDRYDQALGQLFNPGNPGSTQPNGGGYGTVGGGFGMGGFAQQGIQPTIRMTIGGAPIMGSMGMPRFNPNMGWQDNASSDMSGPPQPLQATWGQPNSGTPKVDFGRPAVGVAGLPSVNVFAQTLQRLGAASVAG
jgi:hypothetical protein